MKKLLIILSITMMGCGTTPKVVSSKMVYSDYESMGGFNYMEDVIDAFDTDTNRTTVSR